MASIGYQSVLCVFVFILTLRAAAFASMIRVSCDTNPTSEGVPNCVPSLPQLQGAVFELEWFGHSLASFTRLLEMVGSFKLAPLLLFFSVVVLSNSAHTFHSVCPYRAVPSMHAVTCH